jgi:hypothetical protein
MRLSYDERAGAAYLRLHDDGDDVGTMSSQSFKPPGSDAADDYLEFLTPEQRLLPSVLAAAQRATRRPRA